MLIRRREFLKSAGGAVAGFAVTSPVWGRQKPAQTNEAVVSQAEERIRKYRMGSASLRLTGPDGMPLPPGVSLRISQKRHKFLFGCNIFKLGRCRTSEDNAAYEKQFADLLNYATLPFYWWQYEMQKGRPDDERTEQIVRWCNAHGVTTKGHPLAWNYVDPRWLADSTPEEAMQLQLARIARCAERFQGKVDIWDVVNEATAYDREELKQRSPKLTQAIAKMGIPAYIRTAFKTARQANPQATLLINDYRLDNDYADKVIAQLVDEAGKPMYDVIGLQSHMHGGYWGAARAWDICERFAKFGKPLHFTETTVVSGPKKGSVWATTPEGEQDQAKRVTEFYSVLFSHPAVEAITWWDFTDQGAWQRAPAGLVRSDMSPKPAYEQLHGLIKGKWWTKAETTTGSGGSATFEGFWGQYEIEARSADRRLTGTFSLERGQKSPAEVRLA
ncbi:MAG: endo-1,4-beta-xylanase [Planctomycetes bacterium]|nr:endo-1,4-beta-xylanase [Planctomycetota bacterium]